MSKKKFTHVFIDDRGIFANYPICERIVDIKRFYTIDNHKAGTIRAFHGHLKEKKFIVVVRGRIQIVIFPFEDVNTEKKKINAHRAEQQFLIQGQSVFIDNKI